VHLRLMLPSYPWTRALEAGRVQIPGVTYECAPFIENAPDRFDAFSAGRFDVGEDSVRGYIVKRQAGSRTPALPVFFDREHMQRNIFVRADSPLRHPRDLPGMRVGTRQSLQSGTCAGVLMMLEQGYGVPLDQIHWRTGSPRSLANCRMELDYAGGPATDRENLDLLLRGELDAVISNLEGRYWSLFGPDILDHEVSLPAGVRPLVADPTVIAETYRRTGLYPITDVVVVQPELLDAHPELVPALMQAFTVANALAVDYRSGIEQHLAQMEIALLGEDPHIPGFGDNARKNLAAFIDLLYRLGGIEQPIPPDDLFVSHDPRSSTGAAG
jgi:4,5-dihydroxyphthalate decarboxylase